jgi:hypothetical protein
MSEGVSPNMGVKELRASKNRELGGVERYATPCKKRSNH